MKHTIIYAKTRNDLKWGSEAYENKVRHPMSIYLAYLAGQRTRRPDRVFCGAGSAWGGGGDAACGGSEGGVAGCVSVSSSDVVCVEGDEEGGG